MEEKNQQQILYSITIFDHKQLSAVMVVWLIRYCLHTGDKPYEMSNLLSLSCKTAINTEFCELFSLKRIFVFAIVSHIDCSFRTRKGLTLKNILSYTFL